jgi:hypothetical protein
MPPEMEDFLEVDDHQTATSGITSSSSAFQREDGNLSPSSSTQLPESVTPSSATSSSSTSRNRKQKLLSSATTDATDVSSGIESVGSSVIAKGDKKIREKLKKKMFFVIMSSYIATTLLYALLIYTSLVDVTSTTTGSPSSSPPLLLR